MISKLLSRPCFDAYKCLDRFDEIAQTDAMVCALVNSVKAMDLSSTSALKVMVVVLSDRNGDTIKRLAAAEAIKPRRIKLPDGRIARWDAPDDMVPIE